MWEGRKSGLHSGDLALVSLACDRVRHLRSNTAYTLLWSAAAAAKSLLSCLTLCDPIDGSPPGSPVPGILQARTLEWVAISFSNAWKWKVKVKSLSHVQLLVTPWTAAYQTPLSMGFSRQEYRSGVPLPSPLLWSKNHQIHDSGRCLIFLYQRQMDDVFNVLVSPYWWCHSLYKWGALKDVFMTSSSWEKGGFCAILTERTRFLRKFWEKECDLWENPDIKKNVSEEILTEEIFWGKSDKKLDLRIFWEKEGFWGNFDRRSFLRGIWQKDGCFWGYFEKEKAVSDGILIERCMFLREFSQKEGWFWRNCHKQKEVSDGILTERRTFLREMMKSRRFLR